MKILLINSVCGVGSTGRIVTDLYNCLENNNHNACIAFGRHSNIDGYNTYKIGDSFDIYYHAFMSRLTDREGLYSSTATERFLKKILDDKPDIIHIHNIHGYYINYKILFEFLSKNEIPVVWTLHDCWAFTGHCAYFDFIGCNKWKDCCTSCELKNSYPKSWLIDNCENNYLLKKAVFNKLKNLTIVVPSVWLLNLVKQSFLNKFNTVVINNGIDLNVFRKTDSDIRARYNLNGKKIILGVASPWSKRKGLSDFIRLAKQLNGNYKIILVGLSSKQIKNIPRSIIGLKKTNNILELVKLYSSADVYLNLTYEDNFPTTNLEALACGTPVFTYNTGGSPESISKNSGQVFAKGDLESVAQAIRIMDKEKFISCLDDAKKYDKENMFNSYLKLYEKVFKESIYESN